MLLGGGAFGNSLDHKWRGLINGVCAHPETTEGAPFPILPCENTVRRWLSITQELGPHQTLNLPAPES